MQRPAIVTGGDFGVSLLCLSDSQILSERDDTFELGAVFLQPFQIKPRQFFGSDLSGFDQLSELSNRIKREVIHVLWQLHLRGGTLFESGNFLIASKSVSWFFNPDTSISIFESEKSRPMSFSASATVSRVMVLVLVWEWVSVGVRKRAANG